MGILQIIRFTRNVSQKKMLQLGVVRGSVDVEEQNPKLNQKIFTKFQMLQIALKEADSNNPHKVVSSV